MSALSFKLLFLALMGSGIPVAIAMAGSSLIYILATGIAPDFVIIHRMFAGLDSFPLLAVPFFIFAGNLMNSAGITNRIYNFALGLVGWMRGGLGHVNVVGSVIFSGMSGTAVADAAGLGTIEIKAMREHGYNVEFAVGITAASATLGPIIPPSLPFVVYGMMANVSIGKLFLAGIVPGIVMALLMMATVSFYAHRNKWGGDVPFEWPRILRVLGELAIVAGFPLAIWLAVDAGVSPRIAVVAGFALLLAADRVFRFAAVLPLMTPVLLIGGMTSGLFTATEGAIAACVWAIFLGTVWYRTLSGRMVIKASMETVELTATVLFIVSAASVFGWVLAVSRTTEMIAGWVLAFTSDPAMFLLLANALMLFVGCFLEPTAAITILTPILLPIVLKLGIDPVHFGLVMVLNLMIGLLHPPMGLVLFVLARVANLSFQRTTMAILPWLVPLLLSLALITYVPAISLWLPRLLQ
ncbi:TRAP transporter large permease [Bosea sp. R86505]|jgi:TRAP-type C4-dicarboxylate transport system permease large subunit|uniref:TRAP transporter large permease n=1 Tax=Bosea sp. R86505 TaxID=3101710 RepID=UPI00366E38B4